MSKKTPLQKIMVVPNSALAAVVGSHKRPATEMTRDIWTYIKKNIKSPADDKRMYLADDKLKALGFGAKFHFTHVPGVINKNITRS